MSIAKNQDQRIMEGEPNRARLHPNYAPTGRPKKPTRLGKYAKEHWDSIVEPLIDSGVATAADQPALESLCHYWQRYKTIQVHNEKILDVTSTSAQRAINAELKTGKAWLDVAKQFGLTALARNAISAGTVDGDIDEYLT